MRCDQLDPLARRIAALLAELPTSWQSVKKALNALQRLVDQGCRERVPGSHHASSKRLSIAQRVGYRLATTSLTSTVRSLRPSGAPAGVSATFSRPAIARAVSSESNKTIATRDPPVLSSS